MTWQESKLTSEEAKALGDYILQLIKQGGKDGWFYTQFRKEMTQDDLAKIADFQPSHISKIVRGGWRAPSQASIMRLAKALHTTTDDIWYAGNPPARKTAELQAYSIPVLGNIPCGEPAVVDPRPTEEMLDVAASAMAGCKQENLYALRVSGNSLIGDGIQDGDFLIVDRTAPFVDGEIYVVCLDGECCARHVHRQGDRAVLRSSSGMREISAEDLTLQGGVVASNRMLPRRLLRSMG